MHVSRRHVLGAGALTAAWALTRRAALAAGAPGLTTHMLDVANGKPADGVRIDFAALDGDAYRLTAETMKVGRYQLAFHIAEYFTNLGTVLPNPPFLDVAVIQFGIADATAHYHVPLLASPWTYTTYRGS